MAIRSSDSILTSEGGSRKGEHRVALVSGQRQWGEYVYTVCRSDGTEIGEIAFRNLRRKAGRAEIGIELLRPYRGQGYGPEAIGLLLDELFGSYGLKLVYLRVHEKNDYAQRAYRKCGFRVVRVVRWPLIRSVRFIVMEITDVEHRARRGLD